MFDIIHFIEGLSEDNCVAIDGAVIGLSVRCVNRMKANIWRMIAS